MPVFSIKGKRMAIAEGVKTAQSPPGPSTTLEDREPEQIEVLLQEISDRQAPDEIRRLVYSKFWACTSDDSDSKVEEDLGYADPPPNPATQKQVPLISSTESPDAGWTKVVSKKNHRRAIERMRRPPTGPRPKPWRGPLPQQRKSPAVTLGDALLKALPTNKGKKYPSPEFRRNKQRRDPFFPPPPNSNSKHMGRGWAAKTNGPRDSHV